MKYFTANDARNAVKENSQYGQAGSGLLSLLESVREEAERGNNQTIAEGIGVAINLPAVIAALQQLGYSVQDISNQRSPGGGVFLGRSIRISW